MLREIPRWRSRKSRLQSHTTFSGRNGTESKILPVLPGSHHSTTVPYSYNTAPYVHDSHGNAAQCHILGLTLRPKSVNVVFGCHRQTQRRFNLTGGTEPSNIPPPQTVP
jgi:hypothetical protein